MADIPRFFTTSLFLDAFLPELAIVTIPGGDHPHVPPDEMLNADATEAAVAFHLANEWVSASEGVRAVSAEEVDQAIRVILYNDIFSNWD